jgi:hypothetical protein
VNSETAQELADLARALPVFVTLSACSAGSPRTTATCAIFSRKAMSASYGPFACMSA